MGEEVVSGASRTGQPVVRIGDTIRRPRDAGAELVAALLEHLSAVGFEGCPRFLGYDDQGRQVLSFVEGDVWEAPNWQLDDEANAVELGRVAALVRRVHDAVESFDPPAGLSPVRPLPLTGTCWSHGDVGYQNVVYRDRAPVALIDWEFAAPADPLCDVAGLLAMSVRAPRPGVSDNDRRSRAVVLAQDALAAGYGLGPDEARRLPAAAAAVLDDAATYWESLGVEHERIAAARWRARWFEGR
jgi:hypothetical protein